MEDYPPPIETLLTLGPFSVDDVPDYVGMGLGPEHLPDLIRLAKAEFTEADFEDPRIWAPLHAWWAMGQVGGEAAIEPLIELMRFMEERDADWLEDLPRILAKIGPPAIDPIARVLADENALEYVRIGCVDALEWTGKEHPESRDRCVEVLTHQLAMNDPRIPAVNGFIVSALISLKATESATTIENAYEADCVDPTIAGDWGHVRYYLGLGPMPVEMRRFSNPMSFYDPEYRKSRPDPKKLLKRKAQKDARKQQQARSKKRKRK